MLSRWAGLPGFLCLLGLLQGCAPVHFRPPPVRVVPGQPVQCTDSPECPFDLAFNAITTGRR
jgi:hypothetical protein